MTTDITTEASNVAVKENTKQNVYFMFYFKLFLENISLQDNRTFLQTFFKLVHKSNHLQVN